MLLIHSLPVNMFILLGNTLIRTGTWNTATNVSRLKMNKQVRVWIAKWNNKMQDACYKVLLSNWNRPCTPFYYFNLKKKINGLIVIWNNGVLEYTTALEKSLCKKYLSQKKTQSSELKIQQVNERVTAFKYSALKYV